MGWGVDVRFLYQSKLMVITFEFVSGFPIIFKHPNISHCVVRQGGGGKERQIDVMERKGGGGMREEEGVVAG